MADRVLLTGYPRILVYAMAAVLSMYVRKFFSNRTRIWIAGSLLLTWLTWISDYINSYLWDVISPYPTFHYDDVIMGAISSLITSLTIVYSTVYSDADQTKHQSSASLAFAWGIHRGPAQMASNAENVSIWWRHHATAGEVRARGSNYIPIFPTVTIIV